MISSERFFDEDVKYLDFNTLNDMVDTHNIELFDLCKDFYNSHIHQNMTSFRQHYGSDIDNFFKEIKQYLDNLVKTTKTNLNTEFDLDFERLSNFHIRFHIETMHYIKYRTKHDLKMRMYKYVDYGKNIFDFNITDCFYDMIRDLLNLSNEIVFLFRQVAERLAIFKEYGDTALCLFKSENDNSYFDYLASFRVIKLKDLPLLNYDPNINYTFYAMEDLNE